MQSPTFGGNVLITIIIIIIIINPVLRLVVELKNEGELKIFQ